MRKELSNKPLLEAIFELKWELQPSDQGTRDPNYKILVGMLYDKINEDYPFHEPLEAANMPDEMASYLVQNRFRVDDSKWPLVQIGPGILTINDTANYKWEDFENRILKVLKAFCDVYSKFKEELIFKSIMLRYIDCIDFDYGQDNIFHFLNEKMHTKIGMADDLFINTGVDSLPLGFDLKTTFNSTKPNGTVNLRFVKGSINGISKLFWETMVLSENENIPSKEEIPVWVSEAHDLTDDWFFKLIDGDLLRRFE